MNVMIFLYCGATTETDATRRIFRESHEHGISSPSKEKKLFVQILIKGL